MFSFVFIILLSLENCSNIAQMFEEALKYLTIQTMRGHLSRRDSFAGVLLSEIPLYGLDIRPNVYSMLTKLVSNRSCLPNISSLAALALNERSTSRYSIIKKRYKFIDRYLFFTFKYKMLYVQNTFN